MALNLGCCSLHVCLWCALSLFGGFRNIQIAASVTSQTTLEPLPRFTAAPDQHVSTNFRWDNFEIQAGCYLSRSSTDHDDSDRNWHPLIHSVEENSSLLDCARQCGALTGCSGYVFDRYSGKTTGYSPGTCKVIKAVPVEDSGLVVVCEESPDPDLLIPGVMFKRLGQEEPGSQVLLESNNFVPNVCV